MLKVTILKKEDNICGFRVQNHTDPIVCSAVSVLSQSAVNAVEALTEIGSRYEFEIDEESGYLYFLIPSLLRGEKNSEADLLLRAFELSVKNLSEEYSDYVIVRSKEA
ncbi:MAG: ribosomal-processing cysteine protease Prp [Clostridiales bacterium]|nr:ribosomal-processing cysteine protease Prp [Clostridiales bacterium]MCD8214035.1 ribosomal-processing cysteine protease Prp [Clostridiales bacterium]